MTTVLPLEMPRGGDTRRFAVGVLVAPGCGRVTAALVGAAGHGLQADVLVAGTADAEVPRETSGRFGPPGKAGSCPADSLVPLCAELAEIEAAVVHELLAGLGVAPGRVLAVGVHDPGFWKYDRSGPDGYLGLCDAARLAELTGLNVIDAFPARDLAQGGLGGPVSAMPEWVLLKHPLRSRVLLDLGQTVRMTYLPPATKEKAASRILSFDVGPGMRLLDRLAERLTGGSRRFDHGGHMAVQGRRIDELIDHWLADPYFDRPLPRWDPRGVRPERFLTDALQMAVDSSWSVRDLLCSATHFIAATIAVALRRRLPEDTRIDEIVITGGGQHNGMLLREIGHRCGLPLERIGDSGIPAPALDPAAVAVLALLHIDQVPANPTAVTKAGTPRILGRLTPGSPQSWQRLLSAAAGSSVKVRPLRSAV